MRPAFALLMERTSARKRPRTPSSSCQTSSRFIACPAGCGAHLPNLPHCVKRHLDRACPSRSAATRMTPPETTALASTAETKEGATECPPISQELSPQYVPRTPVSATIPITSANVGVTTTARCQEDTADRDLDGNADEMDKENEQGSCATTDTYPITEESKGRPQVLVSPDPQPARTNSTRQSSPSISPVPSPKEQEEGVECTVNTDNKPTMTNAFAHMMERSSQVFANNKGEELPPVQQTLVLEYRPEVPSEPLALSLCTNGEDETPDNNRFLWSARVRVQDKENNNSDKMEPAIQLTVAATTTTAAHQSPGHQRKLFVQQPSRLSVPVLKSMLQKSIRRRRPLPAVRVAMELMDKALPDVFRRLPIIILEDSTLHPDLPLLVWAMVAHSKGFFDQNHNNPVAGNSHNQQKQHCEILGRLKDALKIRILQIVYEVASCPYQDVLPPTATPAANTSNKSTTSPLNSKDNDNPIMSSLCQPFPTVLAPSTNNEALIRQYQQSMMLVWAMYVRAAYGGMTCDVRMLRRYAQVWTKRFIKQPPRMSLPAQLKSMTIQRWQQVPSALHAKGMDQARLRVTSSILLERLTIVDICKEGVDFHCSQLVDHLMKDADVVRRCCQDPALLPLVAEDTPVSATQDEHIQTLLKKCIWKFSAGVNHRRPLVVADSSTNAASSSQSIAVLQNFWKEILEPRVETYQTNYLQNRLR